MTKTISPTNVANLMGTDGIEFVEFATTDPAALGQLFQRMGFHCAAQHRSKNVLLYQQGDIRFIVNAETDSFAQQYARQYGNSICAIALRVKNAHQATKLAKALGAWEVPGQAGAMELYIPAFQGVAGSLIYLVDRYQDHSIYDVDFVTLPEETLATDAGLLAIHHLVQQVPPGRLLDWQDFYQQLFQFHTIERADSLMLQSACGKIRLQLQSTKLAHDGGEALSAVCLSSADVNRTQQALQRQGLSVQNGQLIHPLTHAELLNFYILSQEVPHAN